MNTSIRLIALAVGLALNTVGLADMRPDASYGVPMSISAQLPAASMAQVDRHLLEALQAKDEAARKGSLQAAQALLDAMGVDPGAMSRPNTDSTGAGDWLSEADPSLDRLQQQTGNGLRESLMYKIWASPYGAISEEAPAALETVTDALRLTREIRQLDPGSKQITERLQSTYWDWLKAYRQSTGLDQVVLSRASSAPIVELRALQENDGTVQLYQLTGTDDATLRWSKAAGRVVPAEFLTSDALTVDLSRETAPWLLVVEGEGLAGRLAVHRFWLEAIGREARLVVIERGDYAAMLRELPAEWFGAARRMPYVLRGKSSDMNPRLHLVHVAEKQVLVSWPLSSLDGTAGTAIKERINHILAAGGAS